MGIFKYATKHAVFSYNRTYSYIEVDPEATTDIRALFYTPIRIQDG